MKLEGHTALGQYLIKRFLMNLSKKDQSAFLLGCQIPDRNPATYLKGSLRANWLRGHNFENAERFMNTLCARLEKAELSSLYDFYSLGKLMHYIADSFTFCHNNTFCGKLAEHRKYENELHKIFPRFLNEEIPPAQIWKGSAIGTILHNHRDYMILPQDPRNDAEFTVRVCCAVMEILVGKIVADPV